MRWILVLALGAGCDKKQETVETTKTEPGAAPSAPGAAPATGSEKRTGERAPTGYVPLPETDLVVKLPDGVVARPMDGRPGFENPGSFKFLVRQLGASDSRTIEEAKGKLKYVLKDVLHAEDTADGYILTHTMAKSEIKEGATGRVHSEESGVEYSLQMRRDIDGTPYKCSAILPAEKDLAAVIAACKSLKKKI